MQLLLVGFQPLVALWAAPLTSGQLRQCRPEAIDVERLGAEVAQG